MWVRVEVPRGSFVKRRPDGSVDFVSPLPSPFDYGSIEDTLAPDGDPMDALILGRQRLVVGARVEVEVWGQVDMLDAGVPDPKCVCTIRGGGPPRERDWRRVGAFFARYVRLKSALNWVRGAARPTRLLGVTRHPRR